MEFLRAKVWPVPRAGALWRRWLYWRCCVQTTENAALRVWSLSRFKQWAHHCFTASDCFRCQNQCFIPAFFHNFQIISPRALPANLLNHLASKGVKMWSPRGREGSSLCCATWHQLSLCMSKWHFVGHQLEDERNSFLTAADMDTAGCNWIYNKTVKNSVSTRMQLFLSQGIGHFHRLTLQIAEMRLWDQTRCRVLNVAVLFSQQKWLDTLKVGLHETHLFEIAEGHLVFA